MDSVAQALRDQGAEVLSVPCDVRSAESVTHLFDTVIQTFGRVDALVNNAGIGFVMKHTRDVAPQEWQLVIDVTLSGVFLCTQAAAQHMEAAGRGGRHYQYRQSGGEIGLSTYGALLRGKAWGHWPDTNCRHRLWGRRHHG
jgi:NAD(P)-dependent dehydrogenase (short-subunit alcohol dehydrogenase family)